MPVFLKLGQSIGLEGFGTFRVIVSSAGAAKADELNTRHVRKIKNAFLPCAELKRSLEDTSFEIIP